MSRDSVNGLSGSAFGQTKLEGTHTEAHRELPHDPVVEFLVVPDPPMQHVVRCFCIL